MGFYSILALIYILLKNIVIFLAGKLLMILSKYLKDESIINNHKDELIKILQTLAIIFQVYAVLNGLLQVIFNLVNLFS